MWSIDQWVCIVVLICTAVIDVKKRKIPVWILTGGIAASIIYQLVMRQMDIWLIAGGILIGIIFLFLSWITEEGIGYGDSLGILCLGIYMGIWRLLEVLCAAFFLLFFTAVLLFWKTHDSRKYGIPFYPLLAAASLAVMIMEKGVV